MIYNINRYLKKYLFIWKKGENNNMKNLTFVEYLITIDSLKGCIILAEYLWQPDKNEDSPFWDFCYSLLGEIFEEYRKQYNETETLLQAIQEVVYISRMIEKQAEEEGRKERAKREASASLYEY